MAKYALIVLLIFCGIGVSSIHLISDHKKLSIENLKPYEETDFSDKGAMSELDPNDRWMLQNIDPPPGIDSKQVYTFECEIISRKPEILTTNCADFGEVVSEIKWTKWEVTGAEGFGVYSINDCQPNCAEGTRHSVPVRVYLDDLTTDGIRYYLNSLTFTPTDGMLEAESYMTKNGLVFSGNAIVNGREVPANTWDISSYFRDESELHYKLP